MEKLFYLHLFVMFFIFLLINLNREFIWFLIILELLFILFLSFTFLIITERIDLKIRNEIPIIVLIALIVFIKVFIKISLF
ncbi:MAG TPA: hypothetical protein EYH54_02030 [Nautiliaceae bacterium]|nr:hypothetical protein [Nautiliaceae bacterium]